MKVSPKHILIIIGLVLCLLFFFYRDDSPLKKGAKANTAPQNIKEERLPARLKIPGIKVDAVIEYVGTTADGTMDVPKNRDNVAWFSPGTRPGDKGSAVIAGHSGYKEGKVAFDDLDTLQAGDKLSIEDTAGMSLSFVVRESRIYDARAYAPEVFTSDSGIHLNLVTCVGTWDKSKKSYTKRLVVFADFVE